MQIRVDVFDVDGYTRIGDGPITTCLSASVTKALDAAGSINLSFPAGDPRALALLQSERRVSVIIEYDGMVRELGKGIIRTIKKDASESKTSLVVSGPDSLDALTRYTVRLNRQYQNEQIRNIAGDLIGLVPGWQVFTEDESGDDLQTCRFAGATVLKALIRMCEEKGIHLREGTLENSIEIGEFGTQSGIVATAAGSLARGVYGNDDIILIDKVVETTNSKSVVNRIIAVGAGEGQAATTLKNSSRSSPYTIQAVTESDGTTVYYIENEVSIALYGVNEQVRSYKEIGPIANSTTAKTLAANALYDAVAADLQRLSVPLVTYSLSAKKARVGLRVGDKIRVRYRGQVERDGLGVTMMDIDEDFWVMKIVETASDNGLSMSLEIASVDRYAKSIERSIASLIESVEVRNVAVQTYPFWTENTWLDTIQGFSTTASREYKEATFKFQVDSSAVDLIAVRVRFKTKPLYTTMYFNGFGDAISQAFYDVVISENHPYRVRMFINDADVSAEFGGPWNNTSVNAADGIDCDITSYILEAAGGLYQDHSIVFKAENRIGNAGVGNPAAISQINSNGFIELNIRVLGVAQAIVPT